MSSPSDSAPVRWPAGLSPRVALASALQSSPGVYAVLAGSGLSRQAGVPTGWEVAQDLARRVAALEGAADPDVENEPENWWMRAGRGELRYDDLLTALGPTDAARNALLRSYFEVAPDGTLLEPSEAHYVIANLVASGLIRVIVTTNFDRLMEQALDSVGVAPQVIANESDERGMIPLVHADATLIKLHGDYRRLGMRNTPAELGTYPAAWRRVLARIFDEFGLLVIGWSGAYDSALAAELRRARSRRYPSFWVAHRGVLSEEGKELVGLRGAVLITAAGADEVMVDIERRVERLRAASARRVDTSYQSNYWWPPHGNTPTGWAGAPLLWLRAAAGLQQVTDTAFQPIDPETRELMQSTVASAALTGLLKQASGESEPASASVSTASVTPSQLDLWHETPEAHQTTSNASYRLGGSAESGFGALVTVTGPTHSSGAQVCITVDIAVSIQGLLTPSRLVEIWAAALLLVAADLPVALDAIVPPEATVLHAELHAVAEGTNGAGLNRPNDLDRRLDLSSFGRQTRPVGRSLGVGITLGDLLTEAAVRPIVLGALKRTLLDAGFTDPRAGLAALAGPK